MGTRFFLESPVRVGIQFQKTDKLVDEIPMICGMVQFDCRRGNTVGNALRGVPLGPERHGGRSLQDFGQRKCYPGLNHA
jgi:hypothetical protein